MTTNRKYHLKSEFALFQTSSILLNFIFCQILAKYSGGESKRTVSTFRKRQFLFCVHLLHWIGRINIRKFHVIVAVVQRRLRNVQNRADKGWAVKRARPSKKVWCSGLGLCLEMSLVFDFGQDLRCGLSIRHRRCHWIMAAWSVFLHFFLVPLCWYAVSEGQMLLFFCGRFSWSRQTSFSKGFSYYFHDSRPLNYVFVLLLANVNVVPKQKQLRTV